MCDLLDGGRAGFWLFLECLCRLRCGYGFWPYEGARDGGVDILEVSLYRVSAWLADFGVSACLLVGASIFTYLYVCPFVFCGWWQSLLDVWSACQAWRWC